MLKKLFILLFITHPQLSLANERVQERFEIEILPRKKVSARLSYPKNSNKKLPVVILLGGFETGENSVDLMPNESPAIFAAVDYPYKAPRHRKFLGDLLELPAIKKAIAHTDLAVDQLIQILINKTQVDPEKIVLVGGSFGAPFVITAANRNPKIKYLIIVHGFAKGPLAIKQVLQKHWGNWSSPFASVLGYLGWRYLDYPNPEEEIIKFNSELNVLNVVAQQEDILPPASVDELLISLARSQAKVKVWASKGRHLHPGADEMLNKIITTSFNWLKAEGLFD